jgi:hypothetical protein
VSCCVCLSVLMCLQSSVNSRVSAVNDSTPRAVGLVVFVGRGRGVVAATAQ